MSTPAERFRHRVAAADAEIDLVEAALLIACSEYPALDIAAYLTRIEDLAQAFKRRLWPDISAADTLLRLNRFLFDEQGFSGNPDDYYDPRNSFLNDVLDRRCGIPITLAIIYLAIGRRAGLALEGVSFPAHFLVKCRLREGTVVLDPYAQGASLSLEDLQQRLRAMGGDISPGRAEVAALLEPASNKQILARLLRNLQQIYRRNREWLKMLAATDRIITLLPGHAEEYRNRGLIYLDLECFRAALSDFQVYLELLPNAKDAADVRQRVVELQGFTARLN
jgi:regulator of sirC expression with transglutaminase-like and TPR domain